MKASSEAYRLIKLSEGLRLKAYRCPAGVLTIGYGHTGRDVLPGMEISEAKAEELLAKDVATVEAQVNSMEWRLTQGQFDAMVDFVFNLGFNKVITSTLFMCLTEGLYERAANQFKRWVFSKGEKLPGLVTRRARATQLFLTGTFDV